MVTSPGSQRARWSSSPKASTIHAAMLWIDIYAAVEVQPAASASKISAPSSRLTPVPPCASATNRPARPSAAALRSVSTGKVQFASHSAANGAISPAAKSLAISWKARCSSESSKSIGGFPLVRPASVHRL